ncbi:MAG: hypothetical protein WBZ51_24750, partial [Xanthobacteraceae bacterium]
MALAPAAPKVSSGAQRSGLDAHHCSLSFKCNLANIVDNDAAFYGGKSAHFSENCGKARLPAGPAVQERGENSMMTKTANALLEELLD